MRQPWTRRCYARSKARGGAGIARSHAHDTTSLRCDTTSWGLRHGRLGSHDTALGAQRARGASRRWRWGAGRWGTSGSVRGLRQGRCDTTTGACDTADPLPRHGRPLATTRPTPCHDTAGDRATIRRPCARLDVPVHTWACQLGQLGARAPGFVLNLVFRLGIFLSH